MADFFAPGFDQTIEQQNIDRQRQYAQALRKQTMPEGRMVGRTYVAPSWTQGLAQMLNAYQGRESENMADEKQKALADAVRGRTSMEMGKFTNLITGTPARDIQPLTPNDDEGNAMPVARAEAQAPDLAGAYKYAAGANTPALQQIGVQGALTQAQAQAKLAQDNAERMRIAQIIKGAGSPQAAIAAGVPAEAVKAYYESPNYGKEKGVAINGQLTNPLTGEAIGAVVPKQLNPTDPRNDLLIPDGNGGFKTNTQLVGVKQGIAKAGAASTNVNVNTATKPFLNEIGKGVGEQVISDFGGARSAQQTLGNIAQIESGLKNVITGPGANVRIKLSQLGQVLGVNGADATEQLQNTRNVIQGLARQELSAAGQMKGQGQITESERGILRRAEAGDISELTKPELTTLLGALRKTATYRVGIHNQNLTRLKKDPNAAGVVDYLTLPSGGAPSASSVMDQADAILNGGK